MLLQTNSYIVPADKRAEHARLLRRFRQALARLGCESFEVYEQVGSNWNTAEVSGRVVQMMRFRDRRHQLAVQAAERNDPVAQAIIAEFCNLINFPYQQQQGLFAVGFYNTVLPARAHETEAQQEAHPAGTGETPDGAAGAAVATAAAGAAAAVAADVAADVAAGPAASATEVAAEPEVAAGDLAREETLAADPRDTPPPASEEHLFAEGTEGIIAAAEQLPDDALDAGGDAAVAAAIAGPEAAGGPAEDASPQDVEAIAEADSPAVEPQSGSGEVNEQDLDLSALLDPHLGGENGNGSAEPEAEHREGGAGGRWEDALSLDGLLDEEPEGRQGQGEPDRDHVSR